ncbi:HTH domain-containing protein, partial [Bacillaceae bacterium Marseille-Q3522]|nr:HTH domain-containing protein [Bacillaceae bacterium Marseille-Q3522]
MVNGLSDRQVKILKILKESEDFVTAYDLSIYFSVSTKTIYRDMQKLSEYNLDPYSLIKKENLGYLLKKNTNVDIEEQIFINSPDERRINLLLYLLSIAPMKTSIQKLSNRYIVSQSSIINDFNHIESKIKPYNLMLLRENNGTYICGHQLSINRLMSVIIESFLKQSGDPFSQYNIPEFIENVKNNYNRLYEVKNFLHEVQVENEILLDQAFYLTLFCSLLAIIEKHKNYSYNSYKGKVFEPVDTKSKEFQLTFDLVRKVESFYCFTLEEHEFNTLYYILKAYKLNSRALLDSEDNKEFTNGKVKLFSKELVKKVSQSVGYNLEDEFLKEQLILHLYSMMFRLNHDIYIVNPILKPIQTNFSETFKIVKQC